MPLSAIFQLYHATSFSGGRRSWNTRREPPTMGKQLVNFITCGCLLAHGRWLSPGTPDSSTTKTGCHDIAEILLKVVLNTKHQIKSNQRIHHYILFMCKIVFNQNIFGMFMSLLYICIKM